MIKEKHLVPGRVLLRAHSLPREVDGMERLVDAWVPCLVVSFIPDIKQRHSRDRARRLGWNVLVMWFDDRQRRLENVYVPVGHQGWKVGW